MKRFVRKKISAWLSGIAQRERKISGILKQMDLIGEISNIEEVEPMTYPFILDDVKLREDKVSYSLSFIVNISLLANISKVSLFIYIPLSHSLVYHKLTIF